MIDAGGVDLKIFGPTAVTGLLQRPVHQDLLVQARGAGGVEDAAAVSWRLAPDGRRRRRFDIETLCWKDERRRASRQSRQGVERRLIGAGHHHHGDRADPQRFGAFDGLHTDGLEAQGAKAQQQKPGMREVLGDDDGGPANRPRPTLEEAANHLDIARHGGIAELGRAMNERGPFGLAGGQFIDATSDHGVPVKREQPRLSASLMARPNR